VQNPSALPLFLQNVATEIPPNLAARHPEKQVLTTEAASTWRAESGTLFVFQGHVPNRTRFNVFAIPSPRWCKVAPGTRRAFTVVLPKPLVEWYWCSGMSFPEGPDAEFSIRRIRLQVDGILGPAEADEMDGVPGVYSRAEDPAPLMPRTPEEIARAGDKSVRLRAELALATPEVLRGFAQLEGFAPVPDGRPQ
jgi:hypothetical protein